MSQPEDSSSWHKVALDIPFPSAEQAQVIEKVLSVDPVLRPTELTREIIVEGSILKLSFQARTVTQARVALDHTLSDLQLVVQTMRLFGPKSQLGEELDKKEDAASIEVGLTGSWEGVTK